MISRGEWPGILSAPTRSRWVPPMSRVGLTKAPECGLGQGEGAESRHLSCFGKELLRLLNLQPRLLPSALPLENGVVMTIDFS